MSAFAANGPSANLLGNVKCVGSILFPDPDEIGIDEEEQYYGFLEMKDFILANQELKTALSDFCKYASISNFETLKSEFRKALPSLHLPCHLALNRAWFAFEGTEYTDLFHDILKRMDLDYEIEEIELISDIEEFNSRLDDSLVLSGDRTFISDVEVYCTFLDIFLRICEKDDLGFEYYLKEMERGE